METLVTGMIVTPGGVDPHVHWLSPQVMDTALAGGLAVALLYSTGGKVTRRALVVLLVALAVALSGCGGQGAGTSCGTNGCTVTFARNGTAEVSVLGVTARLVRVDADIAQVEVAGQTVMVPVGGQTEVAGLVVRVEQITDSQVVVRISTS